MEISFTKLSPNGQIVIPAEIRKDAKLKPATKFIVFNKGGNILLKQISTENLRENMALLEKIQTTEQQIKNKQTTKANTAMTDEQIDNLLNH